MAKVPVPLTALSEEQQAEVYARFEILRSTLEEGVSQGQIAWAHHLSKNSVQRWMTHYREHGLAGLATRALQDKGKSRRLPHSNPVSRRTRLTDLQKTKDTMQCI